MVRLSCWFEKATVEFGERDDAFLFSEASLALTMPFPTEVNGSGKERSVASKEEDKEAETSDRENEPLLSTCW
jgi:hypothetical protein